MLTYKQKIGLEFKRRREEAGLTRSQLTVEIAKRGLEVNCWTVAKFETGATVNLKTLKTLCAILGPYTIKGDA
jgi:hypothetical protein